MVVALPDLLALAESAKKLVQKPVEDTMGCGFGDCFHNRFDDSTACFRYVCNNCKINPLLRIFII